MDATTLYAIEQKLRINEQETCKLKTRVDKLAKELNDDELKQGITKLYNMALAWHTVASTNSSGSTDNANIIAATKSFIDLYRRIYKIPDT